MGSTFESVMSKFSGDGLIWLVDEQGHIGTASLAEYASLSLEVLEAHRVFLSAESAAVAAADILNRS